MTRWNPTVGNRIQLAFSYIRLVLAMAVLGIDLGKATCSVVVLPADGGEAFVFQEDPIVALTVRDGWVVGADARKIAVSGGGEAVWDLLELLGRKETDFSTAQLSSWTFGIERGAAGKALVELHVQSLGVVQKIFPPEELLALLFAHVRRRAEQHMGGVIHAAVLTMPASCSYAQRQALRDAGAMAGLSIQRLVVSSTAAAIAFGATSSPADGDTAIAEQLLLVVDFGAGCLDSSLVAVQNACEFEVKAVAGDSTLGGATLTSRIVEHFMRNSTVQAASNSQKSRTRVRRASQFAKHFLVSSESASVQVQLDSGPFSGSITRTHFEVLCADCWDRIRALVELVLDEARTTPDLVEGVLLCGGSAVVPAVQKTVQNLFPGRNVSVLATDALQARGAAMLAASLTSQRPELTVVDVLPLALGVQRVGTRDVTIVAPANTRVPFHGDSLIFTSSQQTGIVYRVLESSPIRQVVPSVTGKPSAVHYVGTIRLARSSLAADTAPPQVVTKIQIGFDVDEDLQLSVTIVDVATRQSDVKTFTGDEASLPRAVIPRVQRQMNLLFGGHRSGQQAEQAESENSTDETENDGSNGTSHSDESPTPAPEALQQYARDLHAMVATGKIEIPLSDEEKITLNRNVEETLAWLQQTAATVGSTNSTISSGDNDDLASPQTHTLDHDACTARLLALRRLHLSLAASEAIAQLRSLDN